MEDKGNSYPGCDVFSGVEIGIGTWAWGDRMIWGYGKGYTDNDIEEAFIESVENGVIFFDTAEVYGQGKSEELLGELTQRYARQIKVATKMMPYPWRIWKNSLNKALKNSLERLGLEKIDLYQMHWPLAPVPVAKWMNQMADARDEGLIGAMGVSNYSLEQTRAANEALKMRGYRLASNQVEYNLLERRIETNGLKEYCDREGIKIIAYSPLAMGILTGKYTPENPPRGVRASQYNRAVLENVQPLIRQLIRIGNDLGGKTASQVALNWLICKSTLPIPGVKNVHQLRQNIGARGWRLTEANVVLLDEISKKITYS